MISFFLFDQTVYFPGFLKNVTSTAVILELSCSESVRPRFTITQYSTCWQWAACSLSGLLLDFERFYSLSDDSSDVRILIICLEYYFSYDRELLR
jgi:hypothetical protein